MKGVPDRVRLSIQAQQDFPIFFSMRAESDCSCTAYLLLLIQFMRQILQKQGQLRPFSNECPALSFSTNHENDVSCLARVLLE